MKVIVTTEDIAAGGRGDSENCPIARAVQRATGETFWNANGTRIHNSRALFAGSEVQHSFMPIPVWMADWIRAFDRGDSVEPFEFEFTPRTDQ